jgi:hypothetical protein
MADVIDELLSQGSVDPAKLAEILRRQNEHGLVGSLSGSKRLAPVAADMQKEAMGTAAGIGEGRAAMGAAADEDALARWKSQMALIAKQRDSEARARENALNRQNRLDVQGMRGRQAGSLAKLKAGLKGGDGANDAAVLQGMETALQSFESLADKASQAQEMSGRLSTGLASVSKAVPGTPARNLWEFLEPIRSGEALNKLNEMRDAARAMGMKGSGLGQVTEREISLLMASRENVETAQTEKQLDIALGNLERQYRSSIAKIRNEMNKLHAASAAPSDDTDIDALLQDALGDELDGDF